MTADDILRVAMTVTVTQIVCDLLARYGVYEKEPYKKAVRAFERAQTKYNKLAKETETTKKTGKQQDKAKKRLDMAKDEMGEAKSEVAKRHSGPGMLSSFLFLIFLRVLGSEHHGKVMAILPFVPYRLIRKVTLRGLDFGGETGVEMFKDSPGVYSVNQACSFMIIYLLCNLSLKFYVHKLVSTPAPPGADGGLLAVMDNPKIAKGLRDMGLDPDELKQD